MNRRTFLTAVAALPQLAKATLRKPFPWRPSQVAPSPLDRQYWTVCAYVPPDAQFECDAGVIDRLGNLLIKVDSFDMPATGQYCEFRGAYVFADPGPKWISYVWRPDFRRRTSPPEFVYNLRHHPTPAPTLRDLGVVRYE